MEKLALIPRSLKSACGKPAHTLNLRKKHKKDTLMSTVNKYHKEEMVQVVTHRGEVVQIPRSKAVKRLKSVEHDGQKVVLSCDRPYIVGPDGAYKGLKPKMTKAEKKAEKKSRKHRQGV